MWLSSPSVESLTRPRIAVVFVSAVLAVSVGFYTYRVRTETTEAAETIFVSHPAVELRRRNAVRHPRRSRGDENTSASDSEAAGDEEEAAPALQPNQLVGDAETVVEASADDWFNDQAGFLPSQRAGHNIVNLLFRVSEDNARRNGCVHRGCQCNACGMVPIRGVRYRCANCADFDLCETCEAQGVHIKTHIFYKIRVPAPPFGPRQMQPVWYTGDPDTCRRSLPKGLIVKLSRETGFERPELEAFWEQWTFMANTEWRDDPDELCLAMDHKTFERCLVPTGGSRHASPNLIHDRMFSFYDSNKDDLIGFSEFLQGLSYRKRKDKLRKVFDGYDIDGDNFVSRRDFLRMFRAYYVLYKQMHKDILDGLEDQLLASTEAQQLVASRQPLSSLFGREGRVPAADMNLRFEGKTYFRDGTVDIAPGFEHAVVADQHDTAKRGDVLTSLFACADERAPVGPENESNWETVHRLRGGERDRVYWDILLEPPSTLEELPEALMDNTTGPESDTEDEDGDDQGQDQEHEGDEEQEDAYGDRGGSEYFSFSTDKIPTESQIRQGYISHLRSQGPELDRRRRDMAREQLHERWKRRQFYLDEEEGGEAPDDWEDEEDILAPANGAAESSKTAHQRPMMGSRSSSKVRFVQDGDDLETHSNASTSSRGLPERWGNIEIPDAERDAGKEILYQVTQQAFNELLDTIFKPAEDLATEAAMTRALREKYRHEMKTLGDSASSINNITHPQYGARSYLRKRVEDKTLGELLAETGYTVEGQEERPDVGEEETVEQQPAEAVYRDPTLPQFRPNSDETLSTALPTDTAASATAVSESEPTVETLERWKMLNEAEAEARQRGGWGKLSFEEFEEIYKKQEHQGNRLDYLGSWIDFCIP